MGKIFCLMGKSSSGKDSIFRLLKEDSELGLIPIVPYTTRPIRVGERDGIDYNFIDLEKLESFLLQGKVIELRKYDTIKGIWNYCTIDDDKINIGKSNYIYITTLEAYHNLKKYYGKDFVVPIYIEVEDGERLARALARERSQAEPNFDEMCRRFLADGMDYSKEKLEEAGIETTFSNIDIISCVNEIKKIILESK